MPNILTYVATHKRYEFPEDAGYIPVHVGRDLCNENVCITGDNSGDHISGRNRYFCELTALYWIWKNNSRSSNVIGLAHYRRYFKPITEAVIVNRKTIAASSDLEGLMKSYDVLLPCPRNYWIETIEQHYTNAHHLEDLHSVKEIIIRKHPQYEGAFQKIVKGKKLSLYNMFVMKREHFEAYCSWLFDILFEVEKVIPYESYGPYQRRVFGFLGERLLNVWVEKNIAPEKRKYLPVTNLEGENLFLKAFGLFKRKLKGEKQP